MKAPFGNQAHRGLLRLGALLAAMVCWWTLGTCASEYSARLWQMGDGLPHDIVQAVTQTPDGYLWVGTREGLARFDGVRFHSIELPTEVRHPSIQCLHTASDGSVWIGTVGTGLFRVSLGSLVRCPAPEGSTNWSVYEIAETGDHAIWVASSAGIVRYGKGGELQRITDFRWRVESISVDIRGNLWLARNGRLDCLSGPNPTHLVLRQGSLPLEPRKLYCDAAGAFWIAGNGGLTQVKDGVATFHRKAEGPSGFVSAFLSDSSGNLWVGAYAGLSRFSGGRFVDEQEPDEPLYHIYSFFEDCERNLWVASEEGLKRITPKPFRTYTRKDGLSLNSVVSVCGSRDGSMWIGAWGGGLNHWVEGRMVAVRKTDGLSSDFVMSLLEARDGSLWIGTDYGGPLNRIRDGKISQFGWKAGFTPSATTALFEDQRGALWIGTREGLACLRDGLFSVYTTRDGLSHDKVNALCGGRDGTLWIGTDGGLTRWSEGRFTNVSSQAVLLRTIVLSLYEDAGGTLWIGTKSHGLLRFSKGEVRSFDSQVGLASDSVYAVLEDPRGNLWFNSSRGIFRAAKEQFEKETEPPKILCITYGKADGILSSGQYEEVTQPAACAGTDGRLWFRTTQGVAVVDPGQVTTNQLAPPVLIEAVIADGKSLDFAAATGPSAPESASLTIAPGRGELEIHYAALSFRAPEKNQFRYQLEAVDLNPVEAGSRRTAYYNNLRPGTYRFRVAACNNDGVWNQTGASLGLVLLPHFWQTWWFRAAGVLVAAGLVGGTALYFARKRMQRALARLEQQQAIERERARIARDMHDELGAKLTRIFFQGASARRSVDNPEAALRVIETMSGTARDLVTSLDEIVWAVDPENDSLDDLANYVCRYAAEFFQDSPVTCRVMIPPDLPHHRLPTDVRHNVFLAVKEVLHNALKHSQASRVELGITGALKAFEIVISDNGRGFTQDRVGQSTGSERVGHGLANIKERLISIGGRAKLSSEPGHGTEVRLWVPVSEGPD